MGIRSVVESAWPRSRIHTVCHGRLHFAVCPNADCRSEYHQYEWDFEFPVAEPPHAVLIRREWSEARVRGGPLVDSDHGGLVTRRPIAHFFQHDVDSPVSAGHI